jgi:hypothetical protein
VLRSQLPACNRYFALIKNMKKVSYVMVPSRWKYLFAESRIIKPSTVVEIEQPYFKDFVVAESTVQWDQNIKIAKVL